MTDQEQYDQNYDYNAQNYNNQDYDENQYQQNWDIPDQANPYHPAYEQEASNPENYEQQTYETTPQTIEQHLDDVLEKIVQTQPNTEFLDLQNQGITSITQISRHVEKLTSLKDLNLEDNQIKSFNDEPDIAKCFNKIQNLNINGMKFTDFS